MANLDSAPTLQGQTLRIGKQGGVKVNEANVITPDVQATNGLIHIIDTVLMPTTAAAA
ncbi:MAG TPA: fasciclin domain-containing protein [Pyrinomonadaceae bacterium]|nr:fasciclin domain-containing protein [Pyrinomonadaceae bacterium]